MASEKQSAHDESIVRYNHEMQRKVERSQKRSAQKIKEEDHVMENKIRWIVNEQLRYIQIMQKNEEKRN